MKISKYAKMFEKTIINSRHVSEKVFIKNWSIAQQNLFELHAHRGNGQYSCSWHCQSGMVYITFIGRFLSKAEGLSQVWLQSTTSSKTGYVLALQARCFGTQHKGSQDECLFTSRLRAHDNNFSFRALLFFLTIEFKIDFFHQIAIVCISGFM